MKIILNEEQKRDWNKFNIIFLIFFILKLVSFESLFYGGSIITVIIGLGFIVFLGIFGKKFSHNKYGWLCGISGVFYFAGIIGPVIGYAVISIVRRRKLKN